MKELGNNTIRRPPLTSHRQRTGSSWQKVYPYAVRAVIFAGLWWVLTAGQATSWIVGIPVIIVATKASISMTVQSDRYQRWPLTAVLRFLGFFLWQSVRGGIDVAYRALSPQLPLAPSLFIYRLQLPAGLPRIFFTNVISLLPGTLSVALRTNQMTIHTLSSDHARIIAELRDVERHIAHVFAIESVDTDDKAEQSND